MVKYLKGKDGKFTGSIGDGKTATPSPAPDAPTSPREETPSPTTSTLDALAQAHLDSLVKNSVGSDARYLVVQRVPDADRVTPVAVFDAQGRELWNASESPDASVEDVLTNALTHIPPASDTSSATTVVVCTQ